MTKYCLDCKNVFISNVLNKTCPECKNENTAPTWEEN